MKNEIKKYAHTTYCCQYNIVFAPKYNSPNKYDEETRLDNDYNIIC